MEEAWKWVDTILDAWESIGKRPEIYTAGSRGPSGAVALVARMRDAEQVDEPQSTGWVQIGP